MLPLKVEPVVSGSKDSDIDCIDEVLDVVIEAPISNGRVLLDCFAALRAGGRIIWTKRQASSGHWRSAALWAGQVSPPWQ